MTQHTGQCLCGDVKYQLASDPVMSGVIASKTGLNWQTVCRQWQNNHNRKPYTRPDRGRRNY